MAVIIRVLILSGLLSSCTDIKNCAETTNPFLVIDFRIIDSPPAQDTLFNYGLETDAGLGFILPEDSAVFRTILPLDVTRDTVRYTIQGNGELNRLTIAYRRQQRLISEECGFEVIFSDLRLLSSTYDSVALTNPLLEADEQTTDPNLTILTCSNLLDTIARVRFFNPDSATLFPDTLFIDQVRKLNGEVVATTREFSEVGLPLNPEADSIIYLFQRQDLTDTLQLNYDTTRLSQRCVPSLKYSELTVAGYSSSFDTAIVFRDEVSKANPVNIQLFFKPD